MLDHASVGARDLARARAFYVGVLAHAGLRIVDEQPGRFVDFGGAGAMTPVFSLETPVDGRPAAPGNGVHIAFRVADMAAVEAFHASALELGGSSDGQPGPRLQYGHDYHCAFVRDPEGNKIEAVWYGIG